MRKIKFSIAGLAMLAAGAFSSCKEQPVGVYYGASKSWDTMYVASVEAPQTKNYYIEEFTGVRCANCPRAAEKLTQLTEAHPDRLKIVAIHALSFSAPNYDKGSKQDLRSKAGEDIAKLIYGKDPNKPNASFDRLNLGTGTETMLASDAYWDSKLEEAMLENPSTPVNMYLTTSYNADADVYDIRVRLAYTEALAQPHALSVFLVEDNIVDNQIEPFIENFKYQHVLRQAITPVNGTTVLDSISVKQPGMVYEVLYQFKLDPNDATEYKHKFWNLDNVHVVALVHNLTAGDDKRVYQAVDAHLK
ncbi:MAG TPA: Omp28-related outer membrane protein [Edaphocola sp.]|nr:Omp28-related outer membrane protein [Edaphocola sp.]